MNPHDLCVQTAAEMKTLGKKYGVPGDCRVLGGENASLHRMRIELKKHVLQAVITADSCDLYVGCELGRGPEGAPFMKVPIREARDLARNIMETNLALVTAAEGCNAMTRASDIADFHIGDCHVRCSLPEDAVTHSSKGSLGKDAVFTFLSRGGLVSSHASWGMPDPAEIANVAEDLQQGKVRIETVPDRGNADRAQAAEAGFKKYVHEARKGPHEPVATNFTDMLADMMHMADKKGLDFAACLATAVEHHKAERGAKLEPNSVKRAIPRLEAHAGFPMAAAVGVGRAPAGR
jgi:hypothetical protein